MTDEGRSKSERLRGYVEISRTIIPKPYQPVKMTIGLEFWQDEHCVDEIIAQIVNHFSRRFNLES